MGKNSIFQVRCANIVIINNTSFSKWNSVASYKMLFWLTCRKSRNKVFRDQLSVQNSSGSNLEISDTTYIFKELLLEACVLNLYWQPLVIFLQKNPRYAKLFSYATALQLFCNTLQFYWVRRPSKTSHKKAVFVPTCPWDFEPELFQNVLENLTNM